MSPAFLLDMSATGAFIKCADVLQRDSEITLHVKLKGNGVVFELSIQAEVIHAGRYLQGDGNFSGFGVRFKDMTFDDARKLEDALFAADTQPERKYILY